MRKLPKDERRAVQVATYCKPAMVKRLDKYANGKGISRSDAVMLALEQLLRDGHTAA